VRDSENPMPPADDREDPRPESEIKLDSQRLLREIALLVGRPGVTMTVAGTALVNALGAMIGAMSAEHRQEHTDRTSVALEKAINFWGARTDAMSNFSINAPTSGSA